MNIIYKTIDNGNDNDNKINKHYLRHDLRQYSWHSRCVVRYDVFFYNTNTYLTAFVFVILGISRFLSSTPQIYKVTKDFLTPARYFFSEIDIIFIVFYSINMLMQTFLYFRIIYIFYILELIIYPVWQFFTL